MKSQKDLPNSWQEHEAESAPGIFARLRRYAVTGILVIAPAGLTFLILTKLVTWLDSKLVQLIPPMYRPEHWLGFAIPGTGLVAGILLIVIVGMLVRNFMGRWVVGLGERIMHNIPGVRSVYSAIKQIVETVALPSNDSFREVVLLEYPRKGLWAIGFVTGSAKGQVNRAIDGDIVNVFVPTTPNPTSGFLLFVQRSDVKTLDMTVEQGIKMVISAGIVTPTTAEGQAAQQAETKS